MDDFETFKASREKMDPSTRNFSDSQWQQAYVAYCNSRERVSGGAKRSSSGESSGRRRRRNSGAGSKPAIHFSGSEESAKNLLKQVRASSAYQDLRLILDLLAWVAIGVAVLSCAVGFTYYNVAEARGALFNTAILIIGIVGLRFLVHILIDIPDIALHEKLRRESKETSGVEAEEV